MTRVLAAVVIPKKNAGRVSTGVDMSSIAEDFSVFWARYPSRIGKLDAQKAYQVARKHATAEELLAGVSRYINTKPDWQHYKNPGPWLRAGRWLDEPQLTASYPSQGAWWDECKAQHGGLCTGQYAHGLRMQVESSK